ncbi:MAG: pseudouridine synthase, RluA family [Acidimicrobiaceae bacterium]|nr:pseudouridine synthase, RluA family [Acidimicrobiaceae bacterium]
MSEQVEIPATLEGERVDRVVALLSGRPRSEVAALVTAGGVLVDGQVVSRHRRVLAGELLQWEAAEPELPWEGPPPDSSVPFQVVHEDGSLVVVDKPAGVVVHPGAGHREGTLVSGLLARYPDLGDATAAGAWPAERPGLVHRLDKETSGLLVVARTPDALAGLSRQLADRSMGRTYLALALGTLQAEEGTIDAPLGRSSREPTKVAVRADGREARTHYRVLERFSEPLLATLLEVTLETGRTHQIRVHLAAIGHPVAGDARYGGNAKALGLGRPFLHAARLRLVHPETGEALEFSSPLPPELSEVLDGLKDAQERR